MLVDDHLLFLESLQYLLETYGINVVGKVRNGKDAIIKAKILKPDIILMDIRMPEFSGIDTLRVIKAEMPDIKVIMLTTSEDDEDLYNAIKYGACGYLLKSMDAKELISKLEQAMNNEAMISPVLAQCLLEDLNISQAAEDISQGNNLKLEEEYKLSGRQLEILKLVSSGVTYKEIGEMIGLTERTVKYHMGKILERLHLENRSQVIAYVSQKGYFGTEAK